MIFTSSRLAHDNETLNDQEALLLFNKVANTISIYRVLGKPGHQFPFPFRSRWMRSYLFDKPLPRSAALR
jgi:hypothetical protein